MKTLELKNIVMTYQKDQSPTINNLTYTFENENIYLVLGENGAGKSTLMKGISGILPLRSGEIIYNGFPQNVSIQLQDFESFPSLKVAEVLMLFQNCLDTPDEQPELRRILNIDELLSKTVKSLSGGQKKALNIYITFMFNAEIVILDEPMAGLDMEKKELFVDFMIKFKQKGRLIILISHEIKGYDGMYDKILLLQHGVISATYNADETQMALHNLFGLDQYVSKEETANVIK